MFYSSLLKSGCRSKVCTKSGKSPVPAFGSPRTVIVADSVGDCKTFAIRERGICLDSRSGMDANEGVGSVQPELNDSSPDWHGFAEDVIFRSITLTKAQ